MHASLPLAPHDLASAWSFEPGIVLPVAAAALLYGRGLRALWRGKPGRGVRRWEAGAFLAGWLSLALALVSPLHPLGEVLFSAHMVQHELLMVVAAPLLVLGRPIVPFLWALPIGWRRALGGVTRRRGSRAVWGALTAPFNAWLLHGAALWLWHLPAAYQAAVASEAMHALQHACFLGTALLFWYSIIHGREGRMGYGASVFYLFATAMHSGGLGALLTLGRRSWYPVYGDATAAWGLTPLEDQQLAGLIMWIPAGTSYLIAGLILLAAWMRESERKTARWQGRALLGPVSVIAATLLLGGCRMSSGRVSADQAAMLTGGKPEQGRRLTVVYGCGACHTIPGVRGADREVGPPLGGINRRMYIAGVLTNTPEHMVQWLEDPPGVDSLTAMPKLGVSEQEARDIAAYLYTLDR
jgi:putative membrane protein